MKVIRPNCRSQFTAADFEFVSFVLNNSLPSQNHSPRSLFLLSHDAVSIDAMLDDPKLFRALLESKKCVSVSLQFYFYVLVRQSLLREEITSREIADYVAEVLAEFAAVSRLISSSSENHAPLEYVSDMILEIEHLEGADQFAMQSHIGNFALFHSGLFPNRLQSRIERRGAPGFQFYEDLGSAYFKLAGNHFLARQLELVDIFASLGEAFHITRIALNHLSEKLVFLETNRAVNQLFIELDKPC